MAKVIRDRADLVRAFENLLSSHEREESDFVRGIAATLEWLTIRKGAAPISGIKCLWRLVFLDVERELEYARECRDGKDRGYLGDELPPHPDEFCNGVERACLWVLDPEAAEVVL